MKKLFILLLLIALPRMSFGARTCGSSLSHLSDSIRVSGNVLDAFTREYLDSVRVEMYALSNILEPVATDMIDDWIKHIDDPDERKNMDRWNPKVQRRIYRLKAVAGQYVLRFSCPGYKPKEVDVTIPARRYGRRTESWEVKDVLLDKDRSRQLGEAVVTATKIKMYTKGDTVVYNADAFQLAEGSMLDALISMMPGLEIREGSRIYHNGQYVPELRLNGKDFFSGDPAIALQNLPAYTVKDLRIYHRAPDDAYLRTDWTREDTLSWNKTLDVRLKRQYSHGWIANAELAGGLPLNQQSGGLKPLYKARLFGLHYSDHSRLGLFANCNNVNDTGTANSQGDWSNLWQPDPGITTMQLGAVDFNIDDKKTKIEYNAQFQAVHETTDSHTETSSTNFLPSGDVFGRSRNLTTFNRYHLVQKNVLKWSGKTAYVMFSPGVDYFRRYNDQFSFSSAFSSDPHDAYRGATIDSLYLPATSPRLQQMLVNRMLSVQSQVSDAWWQIARLSTSFKDPILGNSTSISIYQSYQREDPRLTQHYNLWNAAQNTFEQRLTINPSQNFALTASLNYRFHSIGWFTPEINYTYFKSYTKNSRELRRQEAEDAPLPSVSDWQTVAVDLSNTFRATQNEDKHSIIAWLRFNVSKRFSFDVRPTLSFLNQRRTDTRGLQPEVSRRTTLFSPMANLHYRYRPIGQPKGSNLRGSVGLSYSFTPSTPDLSYLLDIRDTSDPLRTTLGNPNLRTTFSHRIALQQYEYLDERSIQSSIYYSRRDHQVAQGMSYNPATGAYTYRPENVEGNWSAGGSLSLVFSPRESRLGYSSDTRIDYNHNVDLIAPAGTTAAQRSLVHNVGASEKLGATYTHGIITASADAELQWHYATSERAGFHTRNTFDIYYGATFTANRFLWGLSFTTSLSMRHRRGYDDASMNDNNLLWNAQLSRSFGKAKDWTLMVKAHDILHQLSSVQRTLNAQGLTEVWVNSLPSYLMLHLTYRFNKGPKKK